MGSKGQVSIFVVVSILIVASIILFFTIFRSIDLTLGQEFDNPESFIDKCLRKSVRETVDIMLPQGGFLEPRDYKSFEHDNVAYLCKNVNYYEPCITQHPRYLTELQGELEEGVREDVESCFILLEGELDKRNYQHSGGDIEIGAALKPERIEVTIYRNFSMIKSGVSKNFNSFEVAIKSPLYDLAYLANEIAAQEARFCYFEYVGYMALYPEMDIRKDTLDDTTKIYTLKHKKSGEEMKFATRGCVIPAGF